MSLGFGVASKTSTIGMIERRLGRELYSPASYTGSMNFDMVGHTMLKANTMMAGTHTADFC